MKPHIHRGFGSGSVFVSSASGRRFDLQENHIRKAFFAGNHVFKRISTGKRGGVDVAVRCCRSPVEKRESSCSDRDRLFEVGTRREVLVTPFLAIGAYSLRSVVARAEEGTEAVMPTAASGTVPAAAEKKMEEAIVSRIYDATVIGEPMALGKDKRKVWEKLMNARIVYLGEAEQVPIRDDRELELEIVKKLRKRCAENERPLSLALEAFPCNLQEQLNQYMDYRFVLVLLTCSLSLSSVILTFEDVLLNSMIQMCPNCVRA